MIDRRDVAATLAVGVVAAVAILVAASALPGAIGLASAQPSTIDSCTTLDSPGTYTLSSDIQGSEAGTCIEITASDVTLDGNGHTLAGTGGDAVHAAGLADAPLTGVVVRDLTTVGWDNGTRYENVDDGAMRNVSAQDARMNGIRLFSSNDNALNGITLLDNNERDENIPGGGRGINVRSSFDNTISNVVARNNKYTILFDGGSDENVLRDYRSRNNRYAVYFYASSNNRVVNVTSISDEVFPIYTEFGAADNVFRDFRLDSATMDITGTDFALKPVPSASINATPPDPAERGNLGQYVQLYTTTLRDAGFSVQMSMSYAQDALGGAPESSVSIWQYQDGSWTEVPGSSVDADANAAAMDISNTSDLIPSEEFQPVGVYAPLAQGTTDPSTPTDAPAPINTPVSTPGPTPTATITETATETGTAMATGTGTPTATEATTGAPTTGVPTTTGEPTTLMTTGEVPTTAAGTTTEEATTEGAATEATTETEAMTEAETTETGTDTPTPTETTSDGGPGFGLVAALAAVLASAALLARRVN